MPLVATEYLQILAPLEQMTDAVAAPQLRALWRQIRFMPRTAEKRVREGLGLGPLRTEADGCPPAPPVPVATPSAPGGAWTTLWESPSGNLRCGLAPPTGAGEARVACLDASTATLASMVKGGLPQFTQATPADAAGLPGGTIVDFDESISEYGFMCTLLNPQGMTCRDLETGRGFYVRRGAQGEI